MIATQRDGFRTRIQNISGVFFQGGGEVFLLAPVEKAIAIVGNSQRIKRIKHPRPKWAPSIFS